MENTTDFSFSSIMYHQRHHQNLFDQLKFLKFITLYVHIPIDPFLFPTTTKALVRFLLPLPRVTDTFFT